MFSWCSILANGLGGRTQDIMMYVWGVFEKFAVSAHAGSVRTLGTFFIILKWTFEAMYYGKWPHRRGIR